ncbi:acyl carrier protein [Kitasatospora xanthocidica]|uniref:Acyl carrier protein n=1 Tax=Kitasatospora xanthocidica TaxID=83382 RepID=A0A372ZNM0_9ACTN|nr:MULTISPECIES: phosphopantetheine-binding protein [Streptomycetaceae]OKH98651.1 acyl carrier protein [Streptomyces sp. CB02056]RGD57453.1 acyl carrier protein [Kitasatospora xanthocidica]
MNHAAVVTQFIIEEFLPDVGPNELDADYDLVDGGVIDSLGLLKTIAWLEDRFDVRVEEFDLDPDSFRSVGSISRFIDQAQPQRTDAL